MQTSQHMGDCFASARNDRRGGFTLIEVLIAITILAIISTAVAATISSVATSIEIARAETNEMRLRQFLVRVFTTNFSTVYVDSNPASYDDEFFRFAGVNEQDAYGAIDSLQFLSSAPLLGGTGMPGDLKTVRYQVVTNESDGDDSGESSVLRLLQATEVPAFSGDTEDVNLTGASDSTDASPSRQQGDSLSNPVISPSWRAPIQSMDILYFDGKDWLEEWDSGELGRMPWMVRIKINFAKSKEQLDLEADEGLDPDDDPDFDLVIPLPIGMGIDTDQRSYIDAMAGAGPPGGERSNETGSKQPESNEQPGYRTERREKL